MAVDRTEPRVARIVPERRSQVRPAAPTRASSPAGGPPHTLPALRAELSGLRLAYTLTRLDDLIVTDVTEGARELLGLPIERIVGRPALELVDPKDRAGVLAAVEALRSGGIDFFMANRHGFGARHPSKGLAVWVYAIDLEGVRWALTRWMDPEALARAEHHAVRAIPRCEALAIVDRRGVVKAAIDTHLDLELAIDELVGKPILPAAEIERLLAGPEIRTIRAKGLSLAGPVTVPRRAGGTMILKAVATGLASSDDWLVALMDLDSPPSGREAELEGHLWRIAEIETSGILLRAGRVPKLALARIPEAASLSPRQWEVLRRIMAGERVATIAEELFVSQSTVRNHLSKIFDRFDVHSQPELLARLSAGDHRTDQGSTMSGTMDGLSLA
jgi:DNA-binding CsgD family transcriptional regulator